MNVSGLAGELAEINSTTATYETGYKLQSKL